MTDLTAVLTRLTPEGVIEQASDLFNEKMAGPAMDNQLSEQDWEHIKRSFIGGYCAGWAESQTSLLEALLTSGHRIVKS